MSVRWTYIDPSTVFNPFIGFQTVLIALIGGAATLWGPLIAAIVFSLLAETLRLQLPQLYMMVLGLLLILCVLYLPGGLASLRWSLFTRRRAAPAPAATESDEGDAAVATPEEPAETPDAAVTDETSEGAVAVESGDRA